MNIETHNINDIKIAEVISADNICITTTEVKKVCTRNNSFSPRSLVACETPPLQAMAVLVFIVSGVADLNPGSNLKKLLKKKYLIKCHCLTKVN